MVQLYHHDLDLDSPQNRRPEIVLSIKEIHRLISYFDVAHYNNLIINNALDIIQETFYG